MAGFRPRTPLSPVTYAPLADLRRSGVLDRHGLLQDGLASRMKDALSAASMMKEFAAYDPAVLVRQDILERFRSVSAPLDAQRQLEVFTRQPGVIERALEAAEFARRAQISSSLIGYRTDIAAMASQLAAAQRAEMLNPPWLEAFSSASAMANMFAQTDRVTADLRSATADIAAMSLSPFDGLSSYRSFLDISGLTLPRFPRLRLLKAAEKRRRLKAKLRENAEPPAVRKAKSLVHRYELTLREILDDVMAEAYGEDWYLTRLPACDCNDLLGKWKKRGGEVLDHADFAHYARIMSHPDHYAAVFEAGFDDPVALSNLLNKAGKLRAASHHGHAFGMEDLRDLRLTWKTLETGLVAFTRDWEFED